MSEMFAYYTHIYHIEQFNQYVYHIWFSMLSMQFWMQDICLIIERLKVISVFIGHMVFI